MAFDANSTIAPSRRSLLAIVTSATLLPGAAMASPSSQAVAWRDVVESYSKLHPNAPAAIARAMDEGLDPTTISEIILAGPNDAHLPAFIFGKRTDFEYTICMPHECGDYRRLG